MQGMWKVFFTKWSFKNPHENTHWGKNYSAAMNVEKVLCTRVFYNPMRKHTLVKNRLAAVNVENASARGVDCTHI